MGTLIASLEAGPGICLQSEGRYSTDSPPGDFQGDQGKRQ